MLHEEKENPIVVGLDIGTTKIVAIVGQQDQYGKLKVIGMGKADSQGVARGEVVNIELTVNSIRQAVAEAERQSGVDIKVVYVGIAGEHISSRQSRGMLTLPTTDTEVTIEHIKDMIDDMKRLAVEPGEKIIHVLPQEFSLDNNPVTKMPVGMCGSRLEANFHIITGKVAAAQNIKKCVERAGLHVAEIVLEPLASAMSVLGEDELEAGVAIVDIGGGTTDIAIFHDNIIRHTAVIPFAGNIITNDIKEGCMVLKKQAEKLKTGFGSAVPNEMQDNEIISIPGIAGRDRKEISVRTLSKIIAARLEEIFAQVYFEIKSSGYANKLIAGLVITGGGSQLKHLKQFVEYQTAFDTRIGYPVESLSKDTAKELHNPMYATSIGLVLHGLEDIKGKGSDNKKAVVAETTVIKQEVKQITITDEEIKQTFATVETKSEKPKEEKIKSERGFGLFGGLFKKIKKNTMDWFDDDQVNGDFE